MMELKNITFRVGQRDILHNVSLHADRGSFIGILGPNGAGKSTLIKTMSGEITPTSGEITWLNQSIGKWKDGQLAKSRAVLTQKSQVSLPLVNKEIVMMGRYPHFKHSPETRDYHAVENAFHKTGTHPLADQVYHQTSGGEQQRIQLARVWSQLDDNLSASPKLFLLDEPLNNLDIFHQHQVLKMAAEFAEAGNVVIAVMHDINLAALYMNHLMFLKKGKVVAQGTPDETLTDEILTGVYNYPLTVIEHPEMNTKTILHTVSNTIHSRTK